MDYPEEYAAFSWDGVRRELAGLPDGTGLNIAHEAVDRHAAGDLGNRTAIRWLGSDGSIRDISYAGLREMTNRFANVLRRLGVGKGERVFSLTGRVPELYVAALGTLKNGGIFCPLFSAFGPEPAFRRLSLGGARVLVTTERLYRQKVAPSRARLPRLQYVLLIDAPVDPDGEWKKERRGPDAASNVQPHDEEQAQAETLSLPALMAEASVEFAIPPTDPGDIALLHFTSGTTGMPKGAMHAHEAVLAHYATGKYVLDLHPEDVFWCTADPGWVTGISYGIIAPLANGATLIVDEGDFDALRWLKVLEEHRVSVWYTSPTALRRLMRLTDLMPIGQTFSSHLRLVCSVGEPLDPQAVLWGLDALGLPVHDTWWQTETGAIMIANFPAVPIHPGSMGLPVPGIEAAIVRRTDSGTIEVIEKPGEHGELALRAGWPSMFRGYWRDEERYRQCFADGWYLSGDLAYRDEEGHFWFVGRKDDVIKTSGHLVGPFEVESVLMEHPAVAEAGVIGKPHPLIGEMIKAFIVLKPGMEGSDGLRFELLGFARQRLGAVTAPREIELTPSLPKNRAGKIMRRLLKAREMGLPEGDVSTLETD